MEAGSCLAGTRASAPPDGALDIGFIVENEVGVGDVSRAA